MTRLHGRYQTISLNNICWILVPPKIGTPMRIEMLRPIVIHPHLLPKYVSSGTRRKIAPKTASSFINAPTARAIMRNAVVFPNQPHQVPIMQTSSRLAEDNSNPRTPWNSSQSHFFIPSLILQIHHRASRDRYQ